MVVAWTRNLLLIALMGTALAGCMDPSADATVRIAFLTKDDHRNTDKDPQRLADFLSTQLDRPVRLYEVTSDGAAMQALRFGHAELAFFDGGAAWLAWQEFDLEAVAADQDEAGRTHYTAQAWVRANSTIQSLEQLAGADSCHTGWLKSAGMLMPMGYLIRTGIAQVVGDPEDILALQTTIDAFFDEALVPEVGHPYYNYDGAFRCMTEGEGDVAFVKSTSYQDHCQGHDWCLDRTAYRPLEPAFGNVPSHVVMASDRLDTSELTTLQSALLALNTAAGGAQILADVLETHALAPVTSQGHLGDYSANLRHIPGLQAVYEDKYGLTAE